MAGPVTKNYTYLGGADYNHYYIQSVIGTGQVVATIQSERGSNGIVDYIVTSRTSSTTPGFRALQKSGAPLPVNEFQFTRRRIVGPTIVGQLTQRFASYPYYYDHVRTGAAYIQGYDTGVGSISVSAAQIASLKYRAITDLRLKMKDQHVNLVQMYAERKQTADLFADTALKLYRALLNLKKGNVVEAAKSLGVTANRRAFAAVSRNLRNGTGHEKEKQMSSAWLALQYGWKPLLDDCYGAAEQIAQSATRNQKVRAVSKKSATETVSGLYHDATYHYMDTNSCTETVTIKYVCNYSVPTANLHTLAQLGIINPLVVAWELAPWSFVVDWILPIGNYLNQIDATAGLQFDNGSLTTSVKRLATGVRFYEGPEFSGGPFGTIKKTVEDFSVNRQRLTSFPVVAALPDFKNPFSYGHLANAMALLSQLRLR